jgi:hypothetical protein
MLDTRSKVSTKVGLRKSCEPRQLSLIGLYRENQFLKSLPDGPPRLTVAPIPCWHGATGVAPVFFRLGAMSRHSCSEWDVASVSFRHGVMSRHSCSGMGRRVSLQSYSGMERRGCRFRPIREWSDKTVASVLFRHGATRLSLQSSFGIGHRV